MNVIMLYTSLTLGEESFVLLASFRESSRIELLFRREAGHSATPPQGLSALLFFRERCTMFMFIAAAVILAAVTGSVVAAIRRNRSQAYINTRLRTYSSG